MVGQQQPVRWGALFACQPCPLRGLVDVAGEQDPLTIGLDLQHAGQLIAVACHLPLPQTEAHIVPLPAATAFATFGAQIRRKARRLATDYPINPQQPLNRVRTARMIIIGMTQQQQVQPSHAKGRSEGTTTRSPVSKSPCFGPAS